MIIFQGRRNNFFRFILLFLITPIQAAYSNGTFFLPSLKHPQVSAAGGPSWYNTSDTHMVISSFETDKNIVNQTTVHGSWKIGLNYSLFEEHLKQNKYLNEVLFGLNVYQTSTSLSGMTWQYELPEFNNYHFKAPVTSTRLMLDLRPSFFIWRATTSYAILGAGVTWNKVSYSETTTADVNPNTALSLSSHTTSQAAFDLGLGCKMALTPHLNVSIEYLYAFLGHGSPMSKSNGVQLETAPRFSLQNQSLLFGLNIQL
jgi:opacity protein-like surface antigen